MNIISSPYTEDLLVQWLQTLDQNSDLFHEDVTIVQSQGMRRYLQLEASQANGISAGLSMPFPRTFIGELLKNCGLIAEENHLERSTLAWRIYDLLPEFSLKFPTLKRYIHGEESQKKLRTYQMATALADMLDNYMLFRLEWVMAWGRGEMVPGLNVDHQKWQAQLCQELNLHHAQNIGTAILEFAHNPRAYANSLPFDKLSLFGISTLSRLHIHFFSALGEICPLTWFLNTPCLEYWADIKKSHTHLDDGEMYSSSHPLLASWGSLGKDLQYNLLDYNLDPQGDVQELNEREALKQGSLYRIQAGIHSLDAGLGKGLGLDSSLIINSCHNPMREVEVLYQQCLKWLSEKDHKGESVYNARDIIIMMPKPELYYPYIEAVFSHPEKEEERIAYSLSDRPLRDQGEVIPAFMDFMDFSTSRFTAASVLHFLQFESIRQGAGLKKDDVSIINQWIEKAAIRWGWHGEHRTTFDLPSFEHNSWLRGLERLLLGLCYEGENEFSELLSLPVEASQGRVLGVFCEFAHKLYDISQRLVSEYAPNKWIEQCQNALDELFRAEHLEQSFQDECTKLSLVIHELGEQWKEAELKSSMDLATVKSALQGLLRDEQNQAGFLQGGITFCRMLPMRTIPAKVVAIIGLNEGLFPRQDQKTGFDLMAQQSWRGDRSMAKDDRYLFLEALLAARQCFYLSYQGQSEKDNKKLSPSLLVSELLEYVNDSIEFPRKEEGVQQHPLQSYSMAYFNQSRPELINYSHQDYEDALALKNKVAETQAFCERESLFEEHESARLEIQLRDFIAFFENPSRAFLQKRCQLFLREDEVEAPDESEPFDLGDGLQKYQLKADFVAECSELGTDRDTYVHRLFKKEEIPQGERGLNAISQLIEPLDPLVEKIVSVNHEKIEPLDVRITLLTRNHDHSQIEISLLGQLGQQYSQAQILSRPGDVKGKDKIRSLIRHVLMCAQEEQSGRATEYYYLTKNKLAHLTFAPIDFAEARKILEDLVGLYIQGHRSPLAFFPECSLHLQVSKQAPGMNDLNASTQAQTDDLDASKQDQKLAPEIDANTQTQKMDAEIQWSHSKAIRYWHGDDYGLRGEVQDDYVRICFQGEYPGHSSKHERAFKEHALYFQGLLKQWELKSKKSAQKRVRQS
ncbi:MAG: exodeoxyribonuclease V subunit gamma [Planctomycetes bacterium]|nr:exodeoxyribonuclease V subunit gamma [Planctomycetota bacterium]